MERKDRIDEVIGDFIQKLSDDYTSKEIEAILTGDETLRNKKLGNNPEAFTEDNLIWKILDALDLEKDPRPYGEGGQGSWPDFEIKNTDERIIGENKSPNKIKEAEKEIKNYLDRKSLHSDYGIATDGFTWKIFKIEFGGDFTEYKEIASIELRNLFLEKAREQKLISSTALTDIDLEKEIENFISAFSYQELNEITTRKAKQEIRKERLHDVDEFFELYIEFLMGESRKHNYETTLLDDIKPPTGADERDKRVFAVQLINRLLFIKFLEERGVIDQNFLLERLEEYEENQSGLAGNFYETVLKPTFYNLFNTIPENRNPKYTSGWFTEIPYLNGGLFSENLDKENRYEVYDRVLPQLIRELIEGSKLDFKGDGFDPALLGSVFEKTINYIAQGKSQKDIGAYYTPNDITNIISNESIDPKIKDVLVEEFSKAASEDEEEIDNIKSNMEGRDLEEILREIEKAKGWFGNSEAMENSLDEMKNLKIVDPACGSGHFLTTSMSEVYRACTSIMRGLNGGEEPSAEEKFNLKKELALNCIYGVDVDPIASEIAKLRIWLKIVEDNEWNADFGKLPNIDVNITTGNSLIGYPLKGDIGATFVKLTDIKDEIEELSDLREDYKQKNDENAKEEYVKKRDSIGEKFDSNLLDTYNYQVTSEFESKEEFEDFSNQIETDNLYNSLLEVQIAKKNGEKMTEGEKSHLDDLGFKTYSKSARLDIEDRETYLRNTNGDPKSKILKDLLELFERGFYVKEAKRKVNGYDKDKMLGEPLHWPLTFAEVVDYSDGGEIKFDIVIGNPPYGDISNDSDKALLKPYRTSDLNDVSAQFIERELQLLGDDGYFGNITSLRGIYDSRFQVYREILRENLEFSKVAAFERRPSQIFENAQVQAGIITGRKSQGGSSEILTTKFLRFNKDDRAEVLSSFNYEPVEDLHLGDRISGETEDYEIIPKIGNLYNKQFLKDLRTFDNKIGNETSSSGEHTLYRQRGGGYRPLALIEKIYDSTGLVSIDFEESVYRDLTFLIVNSQTFYLYWMIYSNARNVDTGLIKRFPLPKEEVVEENSEEIEKKKEELWREMKDVFDDDKNYFYISKIRDVMSEIDEFLFDLYDISDDIGGHIKEYDEKYIWAKS